MDGHRDQVAPAVAPAGWQWWLIALAGALLAAGGRLELIHEYGTSLPFRDEWKSTAADLLGPWAEGRLHASAFFAPLNDHWVVLTRLLSFSLARLNGQWNNLLETSVNAVLYGATVWLFLGAIAPALGRRLGAVFALCAGFVLALPYTWENTLWGIQSLVFLQIGLSLVYLRAVAGGRQFGAVWWLGQVAGGLVLFTQQSSVLAYFAAAALLGWRLWRRDGDRRVVTAGLAFAALWTVLYFALAPSLTVTAYHRADSWRLGLDVFLRQLGWPLPHPGWAFLIYLPFLCFLGDRLGRRRLEPADGFLIAAGLWVGAQAAAIGYGRGGDTLGFVSRYCDFLALGFLVNGACLALLWRTLPRRGLRIAVIIVAAGWLGLSATGLWHESVESHARYNLERRPLINAGNLAAVRDYLTTGDPARLSQEKIGDTLYTYPPTLIELLKNPRFRALLPPETGAAEARRDYGRLDVVARYLPPAGRWLVLAGVLFWLGAFFCLRPEAVALAPAGSDWTWARFFIAWSGMTALVVGLLLAWPRPFLFDVPQRWQKAYAPESENVEFIDPVFQTDSGRRIRPDEPIGAVATNPESTRPYWYGTLLGGYAFTGVLHSTPTEVRHRFLFTPFSGWPCWPGNAIRWRFDNPATGEVQWRAVSCSPTEPREAVVMWTEDVSPFRGWRASLYLYDGHADERGWVGVARPAATDDSDFGRRWLAQLRAERAETTHGIILAATLTALGGWLVLAARFWRGRRNPARPPAVTVSA